MTNLEMILLYEIFHVILHFHYVSFYQCRFHWVYHEYIQSLACAVYCCNDDASH